MLSFSLRLRIAARRPARLAILAPATVSALLLAGNVTRSALAALPAAAPSGAGHAATAPIALAAAADVPSGGFTPAQLHAAYALPKRGAAHQTIAVVSVYDDPHAAGDLKAFDANFTLPGCTTADHCLRILNEQGNASPLPESDPTGGQWTTESALGLEMSHAVCQSCSLLLVEANAADKPDLSDAAAAAATAGATVIVTAATPTSDGSDSEFSAGFTPQHAAVVAAAGDANGGTYGYTGSTFYPAALPNVVAVGGTSLTLNGHGGYGAEAAWTGTSSGCSTANPAPSWQRVDARRVNCETERAVADVSAAADPGALAYITGSDTPGGPWYVASGTSVSAPIIAGVIGLAGSLGEQEAPTLYARAHSDPGAFHDIRRGENAANCTSPICRAAPGYDGPTGLGTPDGLAAFLANGGVVSAHAPGVSLAPPRGGLRFGRSWRARLTLRNANPFALQGTLALRRTIRVGGRLRRIVLPAIRLRLGPLASGAVALSVPRAERRLLAGRRGTAYVQLAVRGPAGHAVRFLRALRVVFPG